MVAPARRMVAASSRGRRGVLRRQPQHRGRRRGAHLAAVASAPGTARRIAAAALAPGSPRRLAAAASAPGTAARRVAARRPQPVAHVARCWCAVALA